MSSAITRTRIPSDPPLSVVILAGGHSERIGSDKARLCLNGQTLIQRAVDTLSVVSDDIVCVARAEQEIKVDGATVVLDLPGAVGVLAALRVGLEKSRYRWSLAVACDMPFICLPLVRYLQTLTEGYDIVVPQLEVGLEPLHALYNNQVLESLAKVIVEGRRRVISFYEGLRLRAVKQVDLRHYDPHLRSFFNINTPADLEQAVIWSADIDRRSS
ncbi:MAG: molybdenum cofactor guanylyltransferase [Anaerolineae bacterium]